MEEIIENLTGVNVIGRIPNLTKISKESILEACKSMDLYLV
jgi:hypothetical protein